MNKDRGFSTLSWVKYLLRNVTCIAAYSYGQRKRQVPKEDMYMMTALWMEQSPWNFKFPDNQSVVGDENILNVVGAVYVLPNDRVLSADCSRRNDSLAAKDSEENGIVHGAVQALIKYPDKVKDCQVYLSRKPCAHCVKMMVQAAVKKVFYLPLRPEKNDEGENKSVDALFQVSTTSRSFFVPTITKEDVKDIENSKKPYGMCQEILNDEEKFANNEWKKWMEKMSTPLSWDECQEKSIKTQIDKDMKRMFEWFVRATFATGEKKEIDWKSKKEIPKENVSQLASHLSRLAQMLSNRTDDPNTGVGCVIADDNEIVSIGWNGFPSKALYANHPRGSKGDKDANSKYPHVIHAEQSALMSRNRQDLTKTFAYVNKTPCNECMPMLYQLGVKTVFVPNVNVEELSYFNELPEENKIKVYTSQ